MHALGACQLQPYGLAPCSRSSRMKGREREREREEERDLVMLLSPLQQHTGTLPIDGGKLRTAEMKEREVSKGVDEILS